MNAIRRQSRTISQNIWIAISLFLLSACSTSPATGIPHPYTEQISSTPTGLPGPWQVIGIYNASHNIMTAGFLDEQHVATGGVVGQMGVSSDGANTWRVTNSMADCRYGMDIVSPDVIWTCGGATHVRMSVDGGRTWLVKAAFGDPRTVRGACFAASFLDATTGWLANTNMFGTTTDGGDSWSLRPLPGTADRIATIDTYLPGEGYLLDQQGRLFHTIDDGRHWTETSRLDWGSVEFPPSAYQLVAMRFSDAQHGMIVVSSSPYGEAFPVTAFHTSDGGQTWTSETVPVLAGPLYLSRAGGYLTVITGANQLTLLKYNDLAKPEN